MTAEIESPIRYAEAPDGRVAYQVHGEGDLDIVYAPGLASHLDLTLEQPRYRHYIDLLSQYGRVIRFDRRGSGVSDPLPSTAGEAWETWADDLVAVLDDAGSRRATIIGTNDAGAVALLFATTRPDRTHALVLFNTTVRFAVAPDFPAGHDPEVADLVVAALRDTWGTEASTEFLVPSMASDGQFRRWYARFQRGACSPTVMAENLARILRMDARHVLPAVHCPTLVLHRTDYAAVSPEHGRYMAEHIPGAIFEEVPGADAMIYTEGAADIIDRIGRFLGRTPTPVADDRRFTTVMFTDIVQSTRQAVSLGDQRWRELLDAHDSATREELHVHGGRVVKSTGDGILATFEAPSRALGCALSLRERLAGLGIQVRTGLHSGEVSMRSDGDISGLAVHVAARIMGAAPDGQVLASSTVHDLVTTTDVAFTDHGLHRFKGVPGEHRLYRVATVPAEAVPAGA